MKTIIRQLGPGFMTQQHISCEKCKGTGEYISDADQCTKCKGEKVTKAPTILEINIEKGMKHGTRITFEKQSDQYPGIIPGDVVVVLNEKNPSLERCDAPPLPA